MRKLAVAMLALSCGGGDSLPPCANNDCTLPGRTVVKYLFDHYPERLWDWTDMQIFR